eukprot:8621756-Pyramimonas_sp.AAC.1
MSLLAHCLEAGRGGGDSAPVDDKREDCKNLHNDAFLHMHWSDLCARSGDKEITDAISKTREGKKDGSKKPKNEKDVRSVKNHVLKTERSFLALTDRELRSVSKTKRLTKQQVAALPTMTVPTEADPTKIETVYCFTNPAAPWRTLEVETVASVDSADIHISKDKYFWDGQQQGFVKHFADQLDDQVGTAKLLEKDVGMHMMTVGDWVAAKCSKKDAPATAGGRAEGPARAEVSAGEGSDGG